MAKKAALISSRMTRRRASSVVIRSFAIVSPYARCIQRIVVLHVLGPGSAIFEPQAERNVIRRRDLGMQDDGLRGEQVLRRMALRIRDNRQRMRGAPDNAEGHRGDDHGAQEPSGVAHLVTSLSAFMAFADSSQALSCGTRIGISFVIVMTFWFRRRSAAVRFVKSIFATAQSFSSESCCALAPSAVADATRSARMPSALL